MINIKMIKWSMKINKKAHLILKRNGFLCKSVKGKVRVKGSKCKKRKVGKPGPNINI